MAKYSLTFPENEAGERETIYFEALSFEAVLRLAKVSGKGTWSDLTVDDMATCRIQLVSDTGVWKISQPTVHSRRRPHDG